MVWTGTQAWTGTDLWADAAVPAPLTLTVTPVTSTRNDLLCTAISGASSNDFERNGTVIVYGNPSNSYSDTAATAGSTDSYRARAVD
jgi:hypothetical protein